MRISKFLSLIIPAYCLIAAVVCNAAEPLTTTKQENSEPVIPAGNEKTFKHRPPKVREEWVEIAKMTPEERQVIIALKEEAEKCLGGLIFLDMGATGLIESCHMLKVGDIVGDMDIDEIVAVGNMDINEPRVKDEMLMIGQPGVEKLNACQSVMIKSKWFHSMRYLVAAREVYYKNQNSKMTFKQLCNEIKDF